MAIIHCPSCAKRTSSIHNVCPHCKADLQISSTDKNALRRDLKQRLYQQRMWGYGALTVMVLAILIWWVPTQGRMVAPAAWVKIVFILGLIGQLYTRYHIIMIKRQLKGLEKEH